MTNKLFYENGNICTYWNCQVCNKEIKCCANKEYYLRRNIKNKKVCKKCSLLKQTGKNNPFFGKKHTPETVKKISNSKIGKKTSKHMSTKKYRQMFSKMKQNLWKSGKMEPIRQKLSLLMKDRIANGILKGYNRSKAEDEILIYLAELNISCEPNFILNGKIFDIYIKDLNLIIEYNGDYWHCNPIKYDSQYFNKRKNKYAWEIWEYDKNKLDLLKNNNYNYEIIWENDYKKNKGIIKKIIEKHVKNKQ